MEKQKEVKAIRAEDLTPEQREKWLAFYRKAMQRKRETQAEMREYAKTEEYKESMKRLKERNAERGTPFI
ncbi:hypothetical protein [Spirosoma foliorum]|uniref:Uncharacterized protein n=1 Tax=Spirosoma foliorum TaxID=2710596 RepID=A0A7G5GR46_9BACT|nr:hypothetical protein [Spirosoma foliorum]QMW01338.1 hypothetical protein H3H32_25725 [Spirosoma foliorum]